MNLHQLWFTPQPRARSRSRLRGSGAQDSHLAAPRAAVLLPLRQGTQLPRERRCLGQLALQPPELHLCILVFLVCGSGELERFFKCDVSCGKIQRERARDLIYLVVRDPLRVSLMHQRCPRISLFLIFDSLLPDRKVICACIAQPCHLSACCHRQYSLGCQNGLPARWLKPLKR